MTGLEESSTVAVAVLVCAAVVILAVIFFVVRFGRRQNYVPLEQQQVWHLSWMAASYLPSYKVILQWTILHLTQGGKD